MSKLQPAGAVWLKSRMFSLYLCTGAAGQLPRCINPEGFGKLLGRGNGGCRLGTSPRCVMCISEQLGSTGSTGLIRSQLPAAGQGEQSLSSNTREMMGLQNPIIRCLCMSATRSFQILPTCFPCTALTIFSLRRPLTGSWGMPTEP